MRTNRAAVAAIAGSGALLVGGGSALAHRGGADERADRCKERFQRTAEARGLTVAQLGARIEARLLAQNEAAFAAGRISSEQAARLRLSIQSGSPCSSARHAVRHGIRRMLGSAADYLDLTRAELRAQLPGSSLAALAQKQGKTVAGLKAAMLAPAKASLARAVAGGGITQAQASERLARLENLVDRLVANTFPAR
jgi:hypothetical protein